MEIPTPLIQPTKPLRIELEKEWGNFNELINAWEKNVETPRSPAQTITEMVIETIVNTLETEHIPIALSSKIMLKIEEISPLDVFYNPQHKVVINT